MAYNLIRQGDTDQNNILEYCCDAESDIATLPTDDGAGSTCIVIANSSVWMLGNDKIWHKI